MDYIWALIIIVLGTSASAFIFGKQHAREKEVAPLKKRVEDLEALDHFLSHSIVPVLCADVAENRADDSTEGFRKACLRLLNLAVEVRERRLTSTNVGYINSMLKSKMGSLPIEEVPQLVTFNGELHFTFVKDFVPPKGEKVYMNVKALVSK